MAEDPNEIRRYDQILQCPMTPEERLEVAEELAAELVDLDEHTADMKKITSSLKEENDRRKAVVSALAHKLKNRVVERKVEVVETLHADGNVYAVRQDTGAVVDTRPADIKERNRDLFPGPTGVADA